MGLSIKYENLSKLFIGVGIMQRKEKCRMQFPLDVQSLLCRSTIKQVYQDSKPQRRLVLGYSKAKNKTPSNPLRSGMKGDVILPFLLHQSPSICSCPWRATPFRPCQPFPQKYRPYEEAPCPLPALVGRSIYHLQVMQILAG
jgi:hypothetical protein